MDKLELSPDEALVAVIALERYKTLNYWQRRALQKLITALGLSPSPLMQRLHCKRCGHSWYPKQPDVRICPKCKSVYFDRERQL